MAGEGKKKAKFWAVLGGRFWGGRSWGGPVLGSPSGRYHFWPRPLLAQTSFWLFPVQALVSREERTNLGCTHENLDTTPHRHTPHFTTQHNTTQHSTTITTHHTTQRRVPHKGVLGWGVLRREVFAGLRQAGSGGGRWSKKTRHNQQNCPKEQPHWPRFFGTKDGLQRFRPKTFR